MAAIGLSPCYRAIMSSDGVNVAIQGRFPWWAPSSRAPIAGGM